MSERSHEVAQGLPALPITVVVPAYNRAHMLPRCLASVWAQRPYRAAEVLVVDDGSVDDSADVAERLGATVIRHPKNMGLAAARNTALREMKNEWLALLDTDDEWLPNHLAALWELRDGHALVGMSTLWRREEDKVGRFHGPPTRAPLVLRSPDLLLATDNIFTASASMVRREPALAVGGFEAHKGHSEDLQLWVKLLERHTAVSSPEVTAIYYLHGGQMSGDSLGVHRATREIAAAHLARTGGPGTVLRRREAVTAWDSLRAELAQGSRVGALRCALTLLRGPQSLIGLAILLRARFLFRRRSWRYAADGTPAVAVLVSQPRARAQLLASLEAVRVRDLSDLGPIRALVDLLRRPPGKVIVGSRPLALALRVVMRLPVAVAPASDS